MFRNFQRIPSFIFPFVFAALFPLVLMGCWEGGPDGPDMQEVSGVVTHNGSPIPDLVVIFTPEDTEKYPESRGTTDSEGRFTMMCGRTAGVAPGKHTVHVEDPAALHGSQTSDDAAYLAVLENYGDPETSTKTVTITEPVENMELKLD